MLHRALLALACLCPLAAQAAPATPLAPPARTSSEILWSLEKLENLGRALYVAAHPDDENTRLIAYWSLGAKVDAAYLSLTRGDGGQNLIGPQLGDRLGVIRTQELIAARGIDGGRQFFTRARDFGYSKTPEETLEIWGRDEILADVVWVIRRFQPDVIVTRFGPEPGSTHGHHTASTQLAIEAFDAAADSSRFPEQLEFVDTWQAKRIVWNVAEWHFRSRGLPFDSAGLATIEVGGYDPLLGRSFNEVASASRSQHSSQGFGAALDRGSATEYFKPLAGEAMQGSLFDGIDATWARVPGGADVASRVAAIRSAFDPSRPSASVSALLDLRESLAALPDSARVAAKRAELDGIIASCLGLHVAANAGGPFAVPGGPLEVELQLVNRSPVEARLVAASIQKLGAKTTAPVALGDNERVKIALGGILAEDAAPSQPYWLINDGTNGLFAADQLEIGQVDNDPALLAELELEVDGRPFALAAPVRYQSVDPARGESFQPVAIIPPVAVSLESPVYLFPNYERRSARVTLAANQDVAGGRLALAAPAGWRVEPSSVAVEGLRAGERRDFDFEVSPPQGSSDGELVAAFEWDGRRLDRGQESIRYGHIPQQTLFPRASARAVSLSVDRRGQSVGYLMGAGDDVPQSIREIGYDVELLDPKRISAASLEAFDAVVLGVRVFNTLDDIASIKPLLFDYVERGGTLIAQYNTSYPLKTDSIAPYGLTLSRDRVTDETSAVTLLAPDHPALSVPNRIGAADFAGWTQERGLYFAGAWDPAFVPLLAASDPGENPSEGILLVAKYGEGHYVYTGVSFFRQLPAGVPGAYRLFANLLSLGND